MQVFKYIACIFTLYMKANDLLLTFSLVAVVG